MSIASGGRLVLSRIFAALGAARVGYQTPDYTAYEDMIDYHRHRIVPVHLPTREADGFRLTPAALARAIDEQGLAAFVLLALACVLSYDWYVGGKQDRAAEASQASQAAGGGARVEEKAAPRKPIERAPVAAETKPVDASAPGAPAATAAALPPAPAPIAKTNPELPAPPPATSTSSEPAAEAPSPGACPPAMAAMALCPNR